MWCYSNVRSDPDKHLLKRSCIFWDPSASLGITLKPVRFYLPHSLNALLIKRKHSAASALPDLGTQIWTSELPQPIAQKLWPARIQPSLTPYLKIRDDLTNRWISPYEEDRVVLGLFKFQAPRCPDLFLPLQKERHSFFPELTNTRCFLPIV